MKFFPEPFNNKKKFTRGQYVLDRHGPDPAWPATVFNLAVDFCVKNGSSRANSKFETSVLVGLIDVSSDANAILAS